MGHPLCRSPSSAPVLILGCSDGRLKSLPPFGGRDLRETQAEVLGMLINHLGMVRSSASWIKSAVGRQHTRLINGKNA
jgi:hypothetical protein